MLDAGVTVITGGGGGVPVIETADEGLEGVEVNLVPSTVMKSVIISGKTDASGRYVPVTRFAGHVKAGSPAGVYSVVLIKEPKVEGPSKEESAKMTYEQAQIAAEKLEAKRAAMPRIIPIVYTKAETSPLKLTVEGKKESTLSVDVAKAP